EPEITAHLCRQPIACSILENAAYDAFRGACDLRTKLARVEPRTLLLPQEHHPAKVLPVGRQPRPLEEAAQLVGEPALAPPERQPPREPLRGGAHRRGLPVEEPRAQPIGAIGVI